MATTYSPNLALTLQGTNDNPGTWGNITNTNLGTLLEQAISGYEVQSLTSGTTLTLTIPNGASGVARNMYLEFTGNGSTVIVPSNKKLYFVYNNCTSGTVTMKVAGQTGVTVANGSKQILVSNGTDIEEAVSSVTGTTGSSNTTYGVAAGDSFTSAVQNVAIGVDALTSATSGSTNVAVGYKALEDFTTGSGGNTATYNVGIGASAGGNITTGYANTCTGYLSGNGITTGLFNTALGFEAGITGNYSYSTMIGESAVVTGNNQVQLGYSSTTTYAYGAVQDRSDARDKADIRDTQLGLNFIMALRPRDFKWDMREDYRPPKPSQDASQATWDAWHEACKLANITHNGTHKRTRYHHGLIAQEVKQTMDAMGVDFGGYQDHTIKGGDAVLSLGYEEMIAPLIKAIQELKAEFDEYKRTHP
jgi:hypothetical protein